MDTYESPSVAVDDFGPSWIDTFDESGWSPDIPWDG